MCVCVWRGREEEGNGRYKCSNHKHIFCHLHLQPGCNILFIGKIPSLSLSLVEPGASPDLGRWLLPEDRLSCPRVQPDVITTTIRVYQELKGRRSAVALALSKTKTRLKVKAVCQILLELKLIFKCYSQTLLWYKGMSQSPVVEACWLELFILLVPILDGTYGDFNGCLFPGSNLSTNCINHNFKP